jgi:hypothetical protein
MNRSLWFVAGAGAGVYVVTRARRLAESVTADGLRDRLSGLSVGARLFRDEVRTGMDEAETDLRARLGLVPDGTPELEAGKHRKVVSTSATNEDDDVVSTSSTSKRGSN